jgi:hypothetical protein
MTVDVLSPKSGAATWIEMSPIQISAPPVAKKQEPTFIPILDGRIAHAKANEGIHFGAVTSCLTIAVQFQDGSKVGIHCIKMPELSKGQASAQNLYNALKEHVQKEQASGKNNPIARIAIVGKADFWEAEELGVVGNDLQMGIVNELTSLSNLKKMPPFALGDLRYVDSKESYSCLSSVIETSADGTLSQSEKVIDRSYDFTDGAVVKFTASGDIYVEDNEKIVGKVDDRFNVIKGPSDLVQRFKSHKEKLFLKAVMERNEKGDLVERFLVCTKITGEVDYMVPGED